MIFSLSDGECPGGCSYKRDDQVDDEDVWCFKEGSYVLKTCSLSTTPSLTTVLELSPATLRSLVVAYEEDGIVVEQEDSFNNQTGEAIIAVPPHGNNSQLTVIMQESTVRKLMSKT